MAVALLYNSADIASFKAAVDAAVPLLSGGDRTAMTRLQTALANSQAFPVAPVEYQQGDADTRIAVWSFTGATKANIMDLLQRRYTLSPATEFLRGIWKDMRTTAIDPWPVV